MKETDVMGVIEGAIAVKEEGRWKHVSPPT